MKANEFVRNYGTSRAKNELSMFEPQLSECFGDKFVSEIKRLIESHELIKRMDFWGRLDKGLIKARMVIDNNTLQASYYQPNSGSYYRYGHNSIYIVKDSEWKEIYVGMDSSSLIHTHRLEQAITDVESCM